MEETMEKTKFCKYCAQKIADDAILCTHCGRQVEELKGTQNPQVVINNTNSNANSNVNRGYARKELNKWVALVLCITLGYLGAHKFYEGKAGMGLIYLFTFGLFGIGWLIDIILILLKPNPYYV